MLCYDLNPVDNKRKAEAWLAIAIPLILGLQLLFSLGFKRPYPVALYLLYFVGAWLLARLGLPLSDAKRRERAYLSVLYFDLAMLLLVNVSYFVYLGYTTYAPYAELFGLTDLFWLVLIYHHYRKHKDKLFVHKYAEKLNTGRGKL